ncbi:MAG: EAL domain-containing protein [Acidimicrobiia bacterium]|nr:EAL domain-containing protein [Acidimicrobiia bacterium]
MGHLRTDDQESGATSEDAVQELAGSELRFRALVTASADTVLLIGRDGAITYLSPHVAKEFGMEEKMDRNPVGLRFVHRDDRAEVARVYKAAFDGEPGDRFSVTHRVLVPGYGSVWVEARLVNQLGVEGLDAVVVNAREVTDRVQAERRLRRRLEAEDLLARMASRFVDVRADELDGVLHDALREIGEFCQGDRAWIFQLADDSATIEHTHEWCAAGVSSEIDTVRGLQLDDLPVFSSWIGHQGPLLVSSVEDMPEEQAAERAVLQSQKIAALAGFGMFARGELYGLIGVDVVTGKRRFSESILWLLRSAADVFGAALRRCAVEVRLAESQERFRAMIHHATDGVRLLDADLRVVYASPAVSTITGYDLDELLDPSDRLGRVHPDDRALVARTRARCLASPGIPVSCSYRCLRADGEWIDLEEVMTNLMHEPAVRGVVANMRDITASRRHEAELLEQARRDPLTELPNRRLFDELVDAAISRIARTGSELALVYLDLDRFKLVNDSFGHQIGDALLVEAAARLKQAVRGGDVVARLSGDEFVVLCEPVDGEGEALAIADRVLAAFRQPFSIGHHTIYTTASVGIVLSQGGDTERSSLLRDADAAMYSAKAAGRNRSAVFSGTLVAMARERLEVEVGLRVAVPERQLRLYYQPIVSLSSGTVVGAEALLRWEHPDRGVLSPDAFLDVAEETGMIVPIGEWVMAEACREWARWTAAGVTEGLDLHVNLSVRQLVERGIADAVRRAIGETEIDPDRLCVEITESALLAGDDATRELAAVRACGVRLALDDFGTGHSSLSYLRHLDLDILKIDRSFVDGVGTDEHDTAIVTAIIRLAESLGLSTVGEGVETQEQADALAALGCDQVQGFWCSPALPAGGFVDLIAELGRRGSDAGTL